MEPLFRPFNVIVNSIAANLYPTGFDVSENAPASWYRLYHHVQTTGRMEVSNVNSEKTIFADAETNYAFRAWHDHCHLRDAEGVFLGWGTYPGRFDWAGEVWVYQQMVQDVVKMYRYCSPHIDSLIEAEVLGQFLHKEVWGAFVEDQREFTIAYMKDPVLTLAGRRY